MSEPGSVTSRERLLKLIYEPGKSKSLPRSLHLEYTPTCTCTKTRGLRNCVKTLTPTEILHTVVREARPRKLSAPELGTVETHKDHIHKYVNKIRVLDSQQGTEHLINGPHLYYGDRCCYCQYGHEPEKLPLELDEFWLLRKDSHDERPNAGSAIFIVKEKNLQSSRRRSVAYLVEEPVCGKRNTNSQTRRRHSASSTRSTSKTPGYRRSHQSFRRESQLPGSQVTAVGMNRQMSTTSDTSGCSGAVTLSSRKRVSADPELDSACEETPDNVADVSDKRRRLIVSLFSAFVIMLAVVAVLMISATLSIGAGGTGSA